MSPFDATAGTPAAAQPRISVLRHTGLGAYWLGTYFVITPIYTILLQVQVSQTVGQDLQAVAVGLATGIGGIFAMVLPPLVGHYSDGLRTRWGRRRPILVAGSLGLVLAIVVMGLAGNYPTLLLGFVLVVALVNVAGAAFVAVIPDTVSSGELGRASGFLGFFVQLGSVLSLLTLLFASKAHQLKFSYVVIIAVLLLTLIATLWAIGQEPVYEDRQKSELPSFERLRIFIKPLWTGDFGWAVFTRFLNSSAFYTTLPFLLFVFRDVQKVPNPDQFTATFELVVTAVAIPFAIVFGWLSDRLGRKRFVYASAGISAVVLLAFLAGSSLSQTVVLALGALYGFGYGTYTAVDWALALDTLPDRSRSAKDMGLFHVADALPRVLIPTIAGVVVGVFNSFSTNLGYRAIFVMAAILYVLGAVFVRQIKSVR